MVLMDVVPQALEVTASSWSLPKCNDEVNGMLDRTYQSLQPSAMHYTMRVQLLQRLNDMVQPIAPGRFMLHCCRLTAAKWFVCIEKWRISSDQGAYHACLCSLVSRPSLEQFLSFNF